MSRTPTATFFATHRYRRVWRLPLAIALLLPAACSEPAGPPPPLPVACAVPNDARTLADLLAGFPAGTLRDRAAADRPDAAGALGRNRAAYFSVRFQMGIAPLIEAAIADRRGDLLEDGLRAMEYAMARAQPDGDFLLIVPPGTPGVPTPADLASGRAFFLSAIGSAVAALEDSPWVRETATLTPARARLDALRPALRVALARLVRDSALLAAGDAQAPNRLFFDALAYRTLGRVLGDAAALAAAQAFTARALATQSAEGWFREGSGFDSSYQSVALAVGWRLWAQSGNDAQRAALGRAMSCGTAWLATRLAPDGMIRTDGNSRVFPGGERFLGEEKQVAWVDAVSAFYLAGAAIGDPAWTAVGDRVRRAYQSR